MVSYKIHILVGDPPVHKILKPSNSFLIWKCQKIYFPQILFKEIWYAQCGQSMTQGIIDGPHCMLYFQLYFSPHSFAKFQSQISNFHNVWSWLFICCGLLKPCQFGSGLKKFALDLVVVFFSTFLKTITDPVLRKIWLDPIL